MSYPEFQKYIDKEYTKKHVNFERDIAPQIKKLTTDAFRAVWSKIDPHRRVNSFEVSKPLGLTEFCSVMALISC